MEAREKISSELLSNFPTLSEDYYICNDTYGSLVTAVVCGCGCEVCGCEVCGCEVCVSVCVYMCGVYACVE